MLSRNLLWLVVTTLLSLACYQKAQWNRHAATLSEAMTLIERHYVEPVDQRTLYEGAMRGMASGLDPYSDYIPPREYAEFRQVLDQRFGGIGVMVQRDPQSHLLTVISPLADSPASRAGLREGDVILAIDGQEIGEEPLADIVQRIHGPVGSQVQLRVRHPDTEQPVELELLRAEIRTDSVLGDSRRADGSWNFFLDDDPRILYVRITTFGERTADELRQALRSVNAQGEPAAAVIIDLRDNVGGLLPAAIATCDMFVSQGTIVSTRGRHGVETRRYEAQPDLEIAAHVPIAVLINRSSASASEIVAACLQDHARAVIVGQRSWGKGTVQNIIELEGGNSALRLTTASYWRPSNRNIHRVKDAPETVDWGVTPDPDGAIDIPTALWEQVQRYRQYRDRFPSARRPSPAEPPSPPPPPANPPSAESPSADTTEPDRVEPQREEPNRGEPKPDATSNHPAANEPAEREPAPSGASQDGAANREDRPTDPPPAVDDPQLRRAIDIVRRRL